MEQKTQFIKKKGFHLIANQLHQHPVNRSLVEACLYFLVGRQISIDESWLIHHEGSSSSGMCDPNMTQNNSFNNQGAVLLLASLDKCLLSPDDNNGVVLCSSLLNQLVSTTVFLNT